MGKRCTPVRSHGYLCRKRDTCTALAVAAGQQGFEAIVKSPLVGHDPPRWSAELSYPMGSKGWHRDQELGAVAKKFRGAKWYFSETGPLHC